MKKAVSFSVVSALALSLVLALTDLGEAAGKGKPGGGGGAPIEPAIAYVANQGAGTKIMVANADGTNRIVAVDNGTRNSRPNWSPDGSRILFTSDVNGPGVYCVTIDRKNGQPLHSPVKIVSLRGGLYSGKPVWSPKPFPYSGGTHKIAYADSNPTTGFVSIYLQDISDCQSQTPLPSPTELTSLRDDVRYKHYAHPSWSPAGDELVVLATGGDSGSPIYDVQVITLVLCDDGNICDTEHTSLIQDVDDSPLKYASTDPFYPEWGGATGMDIAVAAILNLAPGEQEYNVWIIPVDDPASAATLPPNTSTAGEEYDPSWSPDGIEIIYSSRNSECKQVCTSPIAIFKRKIDGSGYVELIKEKYNVTQPKWWGPEVP